MELDTNNSGMFQTITGTRCYELSFCYSARMDLSAGFNSLGFTFGDLMGQLLTNVAVKAFGNAWQQQTGQVHLNGTTSLMFNANGASDGFGRSLDNVSVTALPEPESYAMILAGLALRGTIARRLKRKVALVFVNALL